MLSLWLPLTIVLQVLVSPSLQDGVKQIACNQLETFTVEVSPGVRATIEPTELLIQHGLIIDAYSYANSKNVKFVLNDSSIEFKGLMVSESKPEEVIAWSNTGTLTAVSKLEAYKRQLYALLKPVLVFPPVTNGSSNFPAAAKEEIIQAAQSCILRSLCRSAPKLNVRTVDFDIDLQQYQNLDSVLVSPIEEDIVCETQFSAQNVVEVNGNRLIEQALAEFTKVVVTEKKRQVVLPDLDRSFTTGSGFWSANGRLQLQNGYFKDLTTMVRKGNAVLTKAGQVYSVESSFTIRTAFLHYKNYTFSYGILPDVDGTLSGDVNGLTIKVKLSVDYGLSKCITDIDYIRIIDPGTLDLSVTGLSILNSLVSNLLTYLTKYWEREAIDEIEKTILGIALGGLDHFRCDLFKPMLMNYFK